MRSRHFLRLEDFEHAARWHLPACLYGFAANGSEDCSTVAANRASFQRWQLLPEVLADVSSVTQRCEVLGRSYASPLGIAPMGAAALFAHQADLLLAQAAHEASIPFILSGASSVPLEQIQASAPGTWYQGYLPGDEGRLLPLLDRLRSADYEVLVVTVDVPVASNRDRDRQLGFSIPVRPTIRLALDGLSHPRWLLGTLLHTLLRDGMPRLANYGSTPGLHPMLKPPPAEMRDGRNRLGWDHIALLRRHWKGHLVLKGVLAPTDAAKAAGLGVDGLMVSNHGGRQLDGATTPLTMLPAILEQAGSMEVFLDGGVRRATDAIKALALGARMVFIGRPFLYAAAVAGRPGVARAIALLQRELSIDLALLGCTSIAGLGRQHLIPSSLPS